MIVAVVAVALCTLILYPLQDVAPAVSLGVVYMLAVLVVSVIWGAGLGVATAVLSAAAFNFFHLPPVGQFTIQELEQLGGAGRVPRRGGARQLGGGGTRARARDAEERRREADLAAEMARLLLRGENLTEALPTAAARLAQALQLSSAAIEMEAVEGDERSVAFPLREGTRRLGTLLVGADTSERSLRRLQERVVPALEALLSAALEREELLGGVVETASLRRADVVKTALLRAVSHDLRSPLTAISAAGEALGSDGTARGRAQGDGGGDSPGGAPAVAAGRQPARPLAAGGRCGRAPPRRDLDRGGDRRGAGRARGGRGPDQRFALSIDRDLPLIWADSAQLERAFVNVLENARRHSGGHPVSVRARAVRPLAGRGGDR